MTDREKFEAWLKDTGKNPSYGARAEMFEVWRAALASQQPADEGWIEWAGGKMPIHYNELVKIRLRDTVENEGFAGNFTWVHEDDFQDIIAYRVVKP